MAYDAVITLVSQEVADGRLYTVFDVVETEARDTSEFSIDSPGVGRLTLVESDLISGSGSTIQTEFGRLATWTTGGRGHIDQAAAAAASIRIGTDKRFSADDKVYVRSNVNDVTEDHVIRHRFTFVRGHV